MDWCPRAKASKRAGNLGRGYAFNEAHPAQPLARRLLRYESTLFPFVRVPGVEATNNPAERAVHPRVIARTISGGSRSAQGIATRCALSALFATGHARALTPFPECLALLQSPSPQL